MVDVAVPATRELREDEDEEGSVGDGGDTSSLPANIRSFLNILQTSRDLGEESGLSPGRSAAASIVFPRSDLCTRVLRCLTAACKALELDPDGVAYIKGGWVRDRIASMTPNDLDIAIHSSSTSTSATSTSAEEILQKFVNALIEGDMLREVLPQQKTDAGGGSGTYSNLKLVVGQDESERTVLDISLDFKTILQRKADVEKELRKHRIRRCTRPGVGVGRGTGLLGTDVGTGLGTWCDFTCNNLVMYPSGKIGCRVPSGRVEEAGLGDVAWLLKCMGDARRKVLVPMVGDLSDGTCTGGASIRSQERIGRWLLIRSRQDNFVSRGWALEQDGVANRLFSQAITTKELERSLCSICLEGFTSASTNAVKFECGHFMHVGCAIQSGPAKKPCPQCRQKLAICIGSLSD